MIQVNGLTKDYGARRAIDNLTFDAEQGEIVGFLGPNGIRVRRGERCVPLDYEGIKERVFSVC